MSTSGAGFEHAFAMFGRVWRSTSVVLQNIICALKVSQYFCRAAGCARSIQKFLKEYSDQVACGNLIPSFSPPLSLWDRHPARHRIKQTHSRHVELNGKQTRFILHFVSPGQTLVDWLPQPFYGTIPVPYSSLYGNTDRTSCPEDNSLQKHKRWGEAWLQTRAL